MPIPGQLYWFQFSAGKHLVLITSVVDNMVCGECITHEGYDADGMPFRSWAISDFQRFSEEAK